MNFKDKLDAEKNKKIESFALDFAEDLEPQLMQSAQAGYSAFAVHFEGREDTHILRDPLFLEKLKELLEGCKVKIVSDEYTNIFSKSTYRKTRLSISW